MNASSKADYFDSLFHSASVVGLNTSAQIEAGIVGRAVHTVLLPEFLENQEGTLHFHYLIDGGLLKAARDLPGHIAQLEVSLREADPARQLNGPFLEAFVRPHGLDVSGTSVFVDAVERLATIRTVAAREPAWAPMLRVLLRPIAARVAGTFVESVGRQRRYRDKQIESDARDAALQAQRAAEKERILADRRQRQEAEARQREALIARDREAKRLSRAAREEEKAQRLAAKRRDKQRRALKQRWRDSTAGSWDHTRPADENPLPRPALHVLQELRVRAARIWPRTATRFTSPSSRTRRSAA
jgi:hypothetical protein